MATRKIIAYFMHETERNAALGLLQNHTSTDSFVMGEMDETAISQLQNQGLIVEEVKAAPSLTSPVTQSNLHGAIRAQAMASFVSGAAAASEIDFNKPQFYLVWLAGPLLEQWKQELTSAGAEILEALPTGAYKIRLLPSVAPQIQQKPFVTQLHLIEPREASVEFITPQPAPPLPVPGTPSGAFLAAPQVAVAPKATPLTMHTSMSACIRCKMRPSFSIGSCKNK